MWGGGAPSGRGRWGGGRLGRGIQRKGHIERCTQSVTWSCIHYGGLYGNILSLNFLFQTATANYLKGRPNTTSSSALVSSYYSPWWDILALTAT